MTEPRPREMPVKEISVPKIYPWPASPARMPVDGWPNPPELEYRLYHVSSPYWSGTIKVRKILLDEFGPDRAVPFTIWGYLLKEHGSEWDALFEKHGRHEVRKKFVDSVVFVPALEGP